MFLAFLFFLFMHIFPAFLIHPDPVIQSQRDVIREHTKAVDHVAWDRVLLRLPPRSNHGLFRNADEFVYEPLIVCVMDVAIQHICHGLAFRIQSVLAVVAEDRIM